MISLSILLRLRGKNGSSEPADCPSGCFRLQDTLLHTHLPTAAGTKLPAARRAVRPQGPRPAPVCGTPPPATPQPAPPRLAGIRQATLRPAMVAPRGASARTAGTKPQRRSARRRDTAAAGPRRRAQTEGRSRWGRPRPREPARGSLGGMKRPPARWAPPHRC